MSPNHEIIYTPHFSSSHSAISHISIPSYVYFGCLVLAITFLGYASIVHISAARHCIADACIAQIKLIQRFQILLSPYIVPLNIIKDKGIARSALNNFHESTHFQKYNF